MPFSSKKFLSTPSGWRATPPTSGTASASRISIHALRVEGDGKAKRHYNHRQRFLSTPSGWRATAVNIYRLVICVDFYPRPPGGGRQVNTLHLYSSTDFYPRPPGGGRLGVARDVSRLVDFYPRPPGGGRPPRPPSFVTVPGFLSTPSGWRATTLVGQEMTASFLFLSTPSGWRATIYQKHIKQTAIDFYPRPPGGGRRHRASRDSQEYKFLSTPSGWRATAKTDKVFVCFCAKGRRIYLFKTRKEKICR